MLLAGRAAVELCVTCSVHKLCFNVDSSSPQRNCIGNKNAALLRSFAMYATYVHTLHM